MCACVLRQLVFHRSRKNLVPWRTRWMLAVEKPRVCKRRHDENIHTSLLDTSESRLRELLAGTCDWISWHGSRSMRRPREQRMEPTGTILMKMIFVARKRRQLKNSISEPFYFRFTGYFLPLNYYYFPFYQKGKKLECICRTWPERSNFSTVLSVFRASGKI